jgi:hypothetical protein
LWTSTVPAIPRRRSTGTVSFKATSSATTTFSTGIGPRQLRRQAEIQPVAGIVLDDDQHADIIGMGRLMSAAAARKHGHPALSASGSPDRMTTFPSRSRMVCGLSATTPSSMSRTTVDGSLISFFMPYSSMQCVGGRAVFWHLRALENA